jgi:hypothetical protein
MLKKARATMQEYLIISITGRSIRSQLISPDHLPCVRDNLSCICAS